MFKLSLTADELTAYVHRQLDHHFPDQRLGRQDPLFVRSIQVALDRVEYCFKHVSLKAFHHEGVTSFSHLHSDQYTLFLWFLANTLWKECQDTEPASKVFYLNKLMNGFICMYDAEMPDIFLVLHGGGVVLGKASYQDFFVCCQGCTVGSVNGVYPKLGYGVAMAPQSTIVGPCDVGDHTTIGGQALLRSRGLDSDTIYYRDTETGLHVVREAKRPWAQTFFNVPIPRSEGGRPSP